MAVRKHSQSPVPPRKRQAYETRVSTGSTAFSINGSPTRSCAGFTRLPSERTTDNALGALKNGRRETTCTSKAA